MQPHGLSPYQDINDTLRGQFEAVTPFVCLRHSPQLVSLLLNCPKLDKGNYTFNNPIGVFTIKDIQQIFTGLANHLLELTLEDYRDDLSELTLWLDKHLLQPCGLGSLEVFAMRGDVVTYTILNLSERNKVILVTNFLVALGYEFIAVKGNTLVVSCTPEIKINL